jgi:hypothetical protein
MGKNIDDLRDLAESIVEIIVIVHETINTHSGSLVSAFVDLCKDFDQ